MESRNLISKAVAETWAEVVPLQESTPIDMEGNLRVQGKKVKIDFKIEKRDIKFARLAKIADGFVCALPLYPGVDLHFTYHSGRDGVFHLKHENKIIAQLRIADFYRDIEELERDPEMKTKLRDYLQKEWVYWPCHNDKILVVRISKSVPTQLAKIEGKSITFDANNLLVHLKQHRFVMRIPAQKLRQYAASLEDSRIDFLLAVDHVENVLIIFASDNNGLLIPLKFPYQPSDPESALKQLQRMFLDFLGFISPSVEDFFRTIIDYITDQQLQLTSSTIDYPHQTARSYFIEGSSSMLVVQNLVPSKI